MEHSQIARLLLSSSQSSSGETYGFESLRLYPLAQGVFSSNTFLVAFVTDNPQYFPSDKHKYPFMFICEQHVMHIWNDPNWIILPITAEKEDEIIAGPLFCSESSKIKLCTIFSIMLLHHTGCINLFNKDSQNNFKKFFEFAAPRDNFVSYYDRNAFKFGCENKMQEKGLFCVTDISLFNKENKEFSESFNKLLSAMSKLFKNSVSIVNSDNDDYISYKAAWDEFHCNSRQYRNMLLFKSKNDDYQYSDRDKCYDDQEPDCARCFFVTLTNVVESVHLCIERFINKTPTTNIEVKEYSKCIVCQRDL